MAGISYRMLNRWGSGIGQGMADFTYMTEFENLGGIQIPLEMFRVGLSG